MSTCCDSELPSRSDSRKRRCPANNKECVEVSADTMLHHLKSPWKRSLKAQQYYFCDSPDCDIVYFGEDDSMIPIADVRGPIGQKQTNKEKLLCYCFGITQADAETDFDTMSLIIQQTKRANCACKTRNPSGRCCLKDFPKL